MQIDRMKVHRILVGVTAGAILLLGARTAVTAQAEKIGPEEFRERMIAWALASDQSYRPGPRLPEKIAALSHEQVEIWLSTIEDPKAFVGATERVTLRLLDRGTKTPSSDVEAPMRPESRSPTTLTTPFTPDYPPDSGPYRTEIIDDISFFGISGATSTNRCDASSWGDFVGVWWPLNKAFDTLDGACVVAGCDPTGIACGIACGILETAKIALKVAAAPLEACDVHQGAIDGAEIEATYENTLGLVGDIAHVHQDLEMHDVDISSQLATHDLDLKSQLATHDSDIKTLLDDIQGAVNENQRLIRIFMGRQLEIMRLLITPSGRRTIDEEVLTCTGTDCPDYPAFQLCQNGSLRWNCRL